MPKVSEVSVQGNTGEEKKFKIVEIPVDPPNTIRRYLVPVDTEDNDIPIGARMLDERETDGHLARSSRPDNIQVGDLVRRFVKIGQIVEGASVKGTVEAKLKGDRFRVRFEDGAVDRFKLEELARVW